MICDVFLCNICLKEHIADKPGIHTIFPVRFLKCNMHQERKNTHICIDCNTLMCDFCILLKQHKGHNFLPFEGISKMMLEEFEQKSAQSKITFEKAYEKVLLSDSVTLLFKNINITFPHSRSLRIC